uniref:Uncharacterized protein n=1 Tax=Rhizophora mucronata TaxID=61149 RepID=A0A2P2N2E4_RHIMU
MYEVLGKETQKSCVVDLCKGEQ